MIYGYIRVSSDKQTVENQRFEINKFCESNKLKIDDWIEETLSKEVDLYYLLGILNSSMADQLLADQRGGDYHIYPEHIRNIPIPIASKEKQGEISRLAKTILDKTEDNEETGKERRFIDDLVRGLYEN